MFYFSRSLSVKLYLSSFVFIFSITLVFCITSWWSFTSSSCLDVCHLFTCFC